jgi:hypothetical protein
MKLDEVTSWPHKDIGFDLLWQEYCKHAKHGDCALKRGSDKIHDTDNAESVYDIADDAASEANQEFEFLLDDPLKLTACPAWMSDKLKHALIDDLDKDDRQEIYDEIYDSVVAGLT